MLNYQYILLSISVILFNLNSTICLGQEPAKVVVPFLAKTCTGESEVGRVLQINQDGDIVIRTGPGEERKLRNTFQIQQIGQVTSARSRQPGLLTTWGDYYVGDVESGDALRLKLNIRLGENTPGQVGQFLLSQVAAIWLIPQPADTPWQVQDYDWVENNPKKDVILLRNGDQIAGRFERWNEQGNAIRFLADGEKAAKPYESSSIAAIAFDPSLSAKPPRAQKSCEIITNNGCYFQSQSLQITDDQLAGTSMTRWSWKINCQDCEQITFLNDRIKPLETLKPTEVQVKPFGSIEIQPQWNQTLQYKQLSLQTSTERQYSRHGLSMHSRTSIRFPLQKKYRYFTSKIGLDPITGRKGKVDITFFVDGKAIEGWDGKPLSWHDHHLPIWFSVENAQELNILIDFSQDGDIQDHVNIIDAFLVK